MLNTQLSIVFSAGRAAYTYSGWNGIAEPLGSRAGRPATVTDGSVRPPHNDERTGCACIVDPHHIPYSCTYLVEHSTFRSTVFHNIQNFKLRSLLPT
jgi:hypothetical protein